VKRGIRGILTYVHLVKNKTGTHKINIPWDPVYYSLFAALSLRARAKKPYNY